MIRINLLPLRAERRKEDARRLLSCYLLTVTLVLLAMAWWHISGMRQVSRLEVDLAKNKADTARYTREAEQMKVLKAQKAVLDNKLSVINTLEKSKTGPVHVLDELATRLPAQRLWLTKMEQTASTLKLEGQALDNESIAIYMRQLGASNYIRNVDLVSAEQKDAGGAKVMAFVITCQVNLTGEAAPPAPGSAPGGAPKKGPAAAPGMKVAQR